MRKFTTSVLGTLLVVTSVAVLALPAAALGSNLVSESFENSTVSTALTLPPANAGGTNLACLTAGTSVSQTPIPGCGLSTPDASGSGALRLTGAATGEVGGVFSDLSIPASEGIDDTFTLYQYGGSVTDPADGIGFIVNAENPSSPAPPAELGRSGGSLGYSASYPTSPNPTDGLANGYLGIGFDTYGNFSGPGYEGTGCTDPSWIGGNPNQVVARGPGNGLVGYCALNSSQNTYGGSQAIGGSSTSTRAESAVPVEIVLNTTGSAYTMTGSGFTAVSVPAGDYGVAWTPLSGTAMSFVGPLPSTTNSGIPSGLYPSSWINSATGIPWQLGFGWVASTGSFTNIHEVTGLVAKTINPVPLLTAAIADGQSHTFVQGGTATFTLTAGTSASGADESEPVTMAATFPTGLTPGTASGTGWTCTTAGQTVTCSNPVSSTLTAGHSLPVVTLSAAVASDASTVADAMTSKVTVSSNDGNPVQASDVASATAPPQYPAPTVTGVTPDSGSTSGGTTVTITGTGFSADQLPTVFDFGATPATDVVCASTTSCTATIPAGAAGPVIVTATANGGQTSTGGPTYTYVAPTPPPTTPPTTIPPPTPSAAIGYREVASDGGVFAFGSDGFFGSVPDTPVAANVRDVVGIAATSTNDGYWLTGRDGGVFAFGDAPFLGSLTGSTPTAPNITGIASDPAATGYWLVGADGGVFAFGGAPFLGSLPANQVVAHDIVGIAATPDGKGYWLVGADGAVYPFGDAQSLGSAAGQPLFGPITGIAATTGSSQGYWLVGADGGTFAFGAAPFEGSTGGQVQATPVVGIAPTPDGKGYWLAKADGTAFTFGDATGLGTAGSSLEAPMVSGGR